MTLDGRALRLLVMAAWSLFLFWLWTSDEVLRYLGPRTEWVVPVGAFALSAATVAYGRKGRAEVAPTRPPLREVVGAGALLLPIAVAGILSGASLGSLAASQKLTARGVDVGALARLESGRSKEVTFLDLNAAVRDEEIAKDKDIHPGRSVTLTGFVSHEATGADGHFELSRFYITCCVADAIPIGVTVVPGSGVKARPRRDEWLVVTGAVVREGDEFGVRALKIKPATQPEHPYLGFTA